MNNFNKYMIAVMTCASLFVAPVCLSGEQVDQTLVTDGVKAVTIENLSGSVHIIGWNEGNVKVKGELDDKAEKLIFEKNGHTINIKVELPNRGSWTSKGSDLTIHMPADLRMNFEGVSSDVSVENLTSNVIVKTVSGDVSAQDLAEHIELSSVSGNVKARNLRGKISLSSVSGNINDKDSSGRMQLQAVSGTIYSKSSANEVFVNNVSGDTKLTLAQVNELNISAVSGDTEVELILQNNGVIKASSVSGEVELDFQDDVSADFRLKANAGGDLEDKLTNQKAERAKYGPSAKLYFQTGDASGSVRITTVSGDVVVK